MALNWKSACLAGASPWVSSPAPHKPGLLAHVCHRGSRKVDAGRPEVQSHPFIVTLSQKNKVLNSSKVACVVCLSLQLLHSLVTKETEQKPACINHPAADLRLLMTVTKAWLLGCGGLRNFLILRFLLPSSHPGPCAWNIWTSRKSLHTQRLSVLPQWPPQLLSLLILECSHTPQTESMPGLQIQNLLIL